MINNNIAEKQLKDTMEGLKNIIKDIGTRNFLLLLDSLTKGAKPDSKESFQEPFREIEFPSEKKVVSDITTEDINNATPDGDRNVTLSSAEITSDGTVNLEAVNVVGM